MSKQILYDSKGRDKLMSGMQTLARAVRATLGPTGKNVLIDKKYSRPVSTKDGITVSKEVELPDPFENMGAKILNEVASRTNDKVGDGTTTAVVLADRMIEEGRKYLAGGVQVSDLRRGIEKAVERVIDAVKASAIQIKSYKEVRQVAYIASNSDDALGDLIAEAMEKVGKEGVITIEESKGTRTYLDIVKGMQFDKGYISPYFITNPKTLSVEFENPYILFYEKKLSNLRDFIPVLEKVAASGRPLLIIAEDVEGEILAGLVINKLQGVLKVCAVKAPGFGDRRKNLLEDMAILTGGQLISEDLGVTLDKISISQFGRAKKVVVERDKTTIIEGEAKKAAVEERVAQLNAQLEQTTSTYDKEKLTERKAKLSGGIGILYVGGHTETEMKERKDRATDALHASRAAVEEGIVAGGGTALLRTLEQLEALKARGDEQFGVEVVKAAIEEPVRRIAENSGLEPGEVVSEVLDRKGNVGYDAKNGEYVDMIKAGIIDPAKVTITALRNAASAAALNLTGEVLITEVKKKTTPVAGSVT
ncbi:MAG TPA: chaperonin GroEL [Planctomycetota bacterium]|nr:chaperonin GroEL [Planctomycetota bacterium]